MKKIKFILIIFLLTITLSKAEEEKMVFGYGVMDCGSVLSDYENKTYNSLVEVYIISFLSGAYLATNTVTYSSGEALIRETMNYCKNNPLDEFALALSITFKKTFKKR